MVGDAALNGPDDPCVNCAPLIEAHHRIANHLAIIASYARLAAPPHRTGDPDGVDAFLTGLLAQLDAASGLHRLLSQTAIGDKVDAAAFLQAICEPLARLVAPGASLDTAFVADHRLPPEDAALIGQFVAEAVANSAKHAAAGVPLRRIRVASANAADGGLAISVWDNGHGPAAHGKAGLGARLLRSIAARLRARLGQASDPAGYEVRLTLPA